MSSLNHVICLDSMSWNILIQVLFEQVVFSLQLNTEFFFFHFEIRGQKSHVIGVHVPYKWYFSNFMLHKGINRLFALRSSFQSSIQGYWIHGTHQTSSVQWESLSCTQATTGIQIIPKHICQHAPGTIPILPVQHVGNAKGDVWFQTKIVSLTSLV